VYFVRQACTGIIDPASVLFVILTDAIEVHSPPLQLKVPKSNTVHVHCTGAGTGADLSTLAKYKKCNYEKVRKCFY
jgi:hypothetical protein